MKLIGRGKTAEIFEYGQDTIVKLYRDGYPEDAIRHELRMSQLVCSLGIDTPQAHEIVAIGNRHGVVFQRIHGAPLLNAMIRTPWAIRKHAGTLAALHYDVHAHRAAGAFRQQKQVLADAIRAAQPLTAAEKDALLHYLQQLPEGDALCHGDFHPDNVLIGEKRWIIDWMTGMSGSPAGDVARSVVLVRFGTMPSGTPKMVRGIIELLRSRLLNGYIKQYLQLSGMRYDEMERWILPVAAARLAERPDAEEEERLVRVVRQRMSAIS
ncbi:hypothetical protein SD70_20025 [Gordoniibacillus kamchatkensis]|uniref:Aminoglycoside phosphotransferase domain-containing protein n=1 Tax=Gordoniibacillus kamchatkensis TaxID=1590651 RepID=A0ABR5AEL3_9BACL|nr:aminoglycoside phosphotransferase family protein [Paenibacillus sp. VKM B-2647]KIL39474.1 hypothetical protein SD70_20025 [Paenibacillus sp. VKM B-2647]